MSIYITGGSSINLSQNSIDAINGAEGENSLNPFATISDVAGGGAGAALLLTGGTMTGDIIFGTAGQYIGEGNFDTSRGGVNGLSLVCSVGYEFNWQAGWLTTTEQNSTTPRPLYLDSLAGTTLRVWNSANGTGSELSHTGLVTTTDDGYGTRTITLGQESVEWNISSEMGPEVLRLDKNGLYFDNAYGNYKPFRLGNNGLYCENADGFISGELGAFGGVASLSVYGNGTNDSVGISNTGITFPDGSFQSTAAGSFAGAKKSFSGLVANGATLTAQDFATWAVSNGSSIDDIGAVSATRVKYTIVLEYDVPSAVTITSSPAGSFILVEGTYSSISSGGASNGWTLDSSVGETYTYIAGSDKKVIIKHEIITNTFAMGWSPCVAFGISTDAGMVDYTVSATIIAEVIL